MAGQLGEIGDDHPAPDLAVVPGVRVGQHLRVVADRRFRVLARGPADADVLPGRHPVADPEEAALALEVPVLGNAAEHRARVHSAVPPERRPLLDHGVGADPGPRPDPRVIRDHGVGPHAHARFEFGPRVDGRRGMHQRAHAILHA